MKKIILLCLLIQTFFTVYAQKTYTINSSGAITEVLSKDASASYVFKIDSSFEGENFDIYSDSNKHQNQNFNILGTNIPKNIEGGFTVTIDANHKLKECGGVCLFTVTDKFYIKLKGKKIGDFLLTTLALPGGGGVAPPLGAAGTLSNTYEGGSIINDALYISSNLKNDAAKNIIKTLIDEQYQITGASEKNNNKFLASTIPDSFFNGVDGGIGIGTIFNSVAGMDVTNIADGFAKFIVKRTKEELSIAFFKKFKKDIAQNPDLKTVFPATSNLLNAIDEEIYNYSNYINNLREAFRSDLLLIDETLPGIINNHKEFFAKDENKALAPMLKSASYVASSLKHETHPGDILDGYPLEYLNSDKGKTLKGFEHVKGAIQTLQLFSESLKESDTTKHKYWVGIDKVRKLVNDKNGLQIYLGLLLQVAKHKYNNIPFSDNANDNLYTYLNNGAASFTSDYNNYKQYVLELGSKVNELDKMIKESNTKISDSLKVEQYSKFFRTTVQLIQSSTKVSELKFLSNVAGIKDLPEKSKKYFDIAFEVSDLVTSINRKRYAEVVNHVVVIYNNIYVTPAVTQVDAENSKLTRKQEKDITGSKALYVLKKMTEYGAFMSNMINAKNSDDVANAIESVVLPVGSASIKRETCFNVSFNAYCGLFTGSEIIKGVDPNKPFKFNSYGVTAPIGISISKGNSIFFIPAGKSGFSSSFFISLVDLGAIAAYRFQDTTTEQVPTIKLGDIFSPGLFMSLGIPKTPISVNFGAQTGPNLRKVTSTTNDYSKNTYIRYSVSICVDIPLLNLYTKSNN